MPDSIVSEQDREVAFGLAQRFAASGLLHTAKRAIREVLEAVRAEGYYSGREDGWTDAAEFVAGCDLVASGLGPDVDSAWAVVRDALVYALVGDKRDVVAARVEQVRDENVRLRDRLMGIVDALEEPRAPHADADELLTRLWRMGGGMTAREPGVTR
jgi:hypothetical protein